MADSKDLKDLVYVKPEAFNPANSEKIARLIEKINDEFQAEGDKLYPDRPGKMGLQ